MEDIVWCKECKMEATVDEEVDEGGCETELLVCPACGGELTDEEFNDRPMKTSVEWNRLVAIPNGITILDADGWDRANFDYSFTEELITEEEFQYRLCRSTIQEIKVN